MLRWALSFFLVAIVAGIFGFAGIAGAATDVARILFYLFLGMFFLSFVTHVLSPHKRPA